MFLVMNDRYVPKNIINVYKKGNYIQRTYKKDYNEFYLSTGKVIILKVIECKPQRTINDGEGNYFNFDALVCKTNVIANTSTMYYKGTDRFYTDKVISKVEALTYVL